MTYIRFKQLSKSNMKRYFIVVVVFGVLINASYVGISSLTNVNLFSRFSPSSQVQGFEDHDLSFINTENAFTDDKQKWHQVSIYEIFDRYKARTSESCVNVCDAKEDIGCSATSYETWKTVMQSQHFKFIPLLSEFEYIYPFEADYLSQPPLTDLKQLPSLTLSKVTIDGAVDDDVFCDVSDVIKGRVDLVDGFGNQRIMGGDDVRVWIVGGQSNESKAAGHVIDLRNGSYQFFFTCLHSGQIELNVAVAYPREYLRTVVLQTHLGVSGYLAFKFRKGNIEEVTACLSTPNIPGRPCLCNLTSTNQQSLYCGRPLDSRLGCDDWIETNSLPRTFFQNVTQEEETLVKNIAKPIADNKILHDIKVLAGSSGELPSLKPCFQTSPKETWEVSNGPKGYWTANTVWESMVCRRPNMTSEWAASCLKNTKVWVFGDSNGMKLSQVVSALIKGEEMERIKLRSQFIKTDIMNNITLTFTPLEYPLYLGKQWRKRFSFGGVAKQIDNIPAEGAQVVVIHYYLHIAFSHLSAMFLRLKAAKEAVLRLIDRNPDVLVGIRGPHVSSVEYINNHGIGGDNLGKYMLEMTRYVFSDLKHRVIFLDGWEMTIALENPIFHPINNVPFEMMRTLLSFKCP